eukprot:3118955-Alexandrium_andersonii.AAC.1
MSDNAISDEKLPLTMTFAERGSSQLASRRKIFGRSCEARSLSSRSAGADLAERARNISCD